MNRTMNANEWALLVLLSLLWGGAFFFSTVALAELQPFTVVLARVSLAAGVLWIVLWLTGQRFPRQPVLLRRFLMLGLLNNLLPFSLIFYAQTQIPSGLAAILNATTPLWAILLAQWFTRDEPLTLRRLVGVLIGIGGVVAVTGPDLLGGGESHVLAQGAVILAALAYASAGLYGKRIAGVAPFVTATGQVTASAILLLPIVLLVDQPWRQPLPGLTTWGALLGLAVLSTALAYGLYFRLLATAGATNVLLVTLLIPISAMLLGTLILGERITSSDLIGMVGIGLGLLVIDGRVLRRMGRQQPAHPLPKHPS